MNDNDYLRFSNQKVTINSLSLRLCVSIFFVAMLVFLTGFAVYLYFQEDRVKEDTVYKAQMALNEHVLEAEKVLMINDTVPDSIRLGKALSVVHQIKPYKNSYVIVVDSDGQFLSHPDSMLGNTRSTIFYCAKVMGEPSLDSLGRRMTHGETGMREVFKGAVRSLAIYRPLRPTGISVAVICSRLDVFTSLSDIFWFAAGALCIGLIILFIFSVYVIKRELAPLERFSESASEIAKGNLHVELPEIKTHDEMWHLRESFVYMQRSLQSYIHELTQSTASNERIKSELSIARRIQFNMIPKEFHTFPDSYGIDFYASLLPVKEVGGDLYDVYFYQGKLCFIVGDVSGKGVPAAMYMAQTMRVFRIACRHHINRADEIAEAVSRTMEENNRDNMFITAFIGIIDFANNTLDYCNAGHNLPLLMLPDGSCRYLEGETNIPLGIMERFEFEGADIPFTDGCKLIVYTDGITEAENIHHEQYGEERLYLLVSGMGPLSCRDIVETIDNDVKTFAEKTEQTDDLTILCLHRIYPRRQWKLENRLEEITGLEFFLKQVAADFNIPQETVLSTTLALEEALVNVIKYAYPEQEKGEINLTAINKGTSLSFILSDTGIPFNPLKVEDADTESALHERKIGGLGIYLVKALMDEVHYERKENRNCLTMNKII